MTDCAICTKHHPDDAGDCTSRCRHRDATIGSLCARCHLRILDHLDLIGEAVALSAPVAVHGSKVRQAFGSKPPVSADWLDWMRGDELRDCLGSWCRVVHEDHSEFPWPRTTSAAFVVWLRERMHDVLPAFEAIAEFAAEVDVWAREARRVLGRTPTGEIIGCPQCSARLRVDIAADRDATVTCRRCGMTGTAAWMVRLASVDGWADADAIGSWFAVSERSLRRWARAALVRTKGRHPVTYSIADVRDCAAGECGP